jgi:two-component system, OmpR family, sensor histidine kinase KdpD
VGTLSVKVQPEDFDTILKSAHAQLQAITHEHLFVVDTGERLPLIMADRQRIAQILVNLVDNAAKYSPPGTQIQLLTHQIGNWIQIDIIDQGVGIPLEEQSAVFEAFRQAENRVQKSRRGAGLGLAICKGLIEAHGGRIWIDNTRPVGTTISFTLPIATENAI